MPSCCKAPARFTGRPGHDRGHHRHETGYGRNTGSFRVLDALATVAFDYPRRASYFQQELTEFLLLAKEERRDPTEFKGSYAGAMGWPQFMPSSFRKWAVDGDADGHRDI